MTIALPAFAQDPGGPGVPPFATIVASPYDRINLATGGITFTFPIRSKSTPLPYSLQLTGSTSLETWHDIGTGITSWSDAAIVGYAGWLNNPEFSSPGMPAGLNYTSSLQYCGQLGVNQETYYVYDSFVLIDSTGAVHRTNVPAFYVIPCGPVYGTSPAGTGQIYHTIDGSGYTLANTSTVPGTFSFVIYDRSGNRVACSSPNGCSTIATAPLQTVTSPNGTILSNVTSTSTYNSQTQGSTNVVSYTDAYNQQFLDSSISPASSSSPPSTSYTYTDSAGNPQTYTIGYASQTLQTNFGCPGIAELAPESVSLPSSLTLPSGRAFKFTYETTPGYSSSTTGRLASIELPEGGSLSYTYSGENNDGIVNNGISCDDPPGVPILTRTLTDGSGTFSQWIYLLPVPNRGQILTQAEVLDPYNNTSNYLFYNNYQTQIVTYLGCCNQILKTVLTCYNAVFTNCATGDSYTSANAPSSGVNQMDVYTSYGNGPTSLTETIFNSYGVPTEVKQYDYGATMPPTGSPLTDTIATYGTWNGSECVAISQFINDHPCEIIVKSGATIVSDTRNTYDPNGNLINKARLASGSRYISQVFAYNANGTLHTSTDGNGNLTTYTSADCNNMLPTQVTAGGITTTEAWDCNGGVITSTTGPNPNQTTNYSYNDPFYRLTGVQNPDGGGGSICYTDVGGNLCNQSATLNQVYTSVAASPDPAQLSITTQDGLGRQILATNPDGSMVKTSYDALGNVSSVSNPYYSTSDPTYGVTQFSYDALGRKITQTQPDGSVLQWCYDGVAVSTAQTGCSSNKSSVANASWVDSLDETGKHKQQVSDGLGRLVATMEPDPATNTLALETDYTYDALNNLLSVNQRGNSTDTPRVRSFSYDSLSRLLTSTNPETGTICYGPFSSAAGGSGHGPCLDGYDANGNLLYKTDARGVVTSYKYDALNRLTSKSYSASGNAASTLSSTYVYDSLNGAAVSNGIGRLVAEYTGPANAPVTQRTILSYDPMGRITNEQQCITVAGCSGISFQFQYLYDLAGNIVSSNNGDPNMGIGLTSVYDSVGRLQTLSSTWDDPTHPSGLLSTVGSSNPGTSAYDAMGHLINGQLGVASGQATGAIQLTRQYDNRDRIISEQDNTKTHFGTVTIQGKERSQTVNGGNYASLSISIPVGLYQCGGNAMIYVNNSLFTSVPFSWYYGPESPSAGLASSIMGALNVPGSLVTAQLNGTVSSYFGTLTVLKLTSNTPGTVGNIPFGVTLVSSDPEWGYEHGYGWGSEVNCGAASGTLTGGLDSNTFVYDSGTISVVTPDPGQIYASVSWGQGDTVQSIVSNLAVAIQTIQGVTASISGNTITITADSQTESSSSPLSINVVDSANFSTPSFTGTASGMSASSIYSYTIPSGGYTGASNLLSVNDSIIGSWNYTYDNLNRLTAATANAASYMGSSIWGTTLNWNYDSFGNRLVQSTNNLILPSGSIQYSAPNNQAIGTGLSSNPSTSLTSFQYDAAGNLTGQNGNTTTLFDAEGRLCATSSGTGGYMQYIYDAEGRRVAKGVVNSLSCDLSSNQFSPTNEYLLGLDGEQISELNGQGAWLHSNVYAGGSLLATYNTAGLHFHFSDWLGTRRVQTSAIGAVEETCQSLPFGDGLVCNGPDATEQHFTGKERDSESGLDNFGARYFASSMGRFMSPDPSGLYFADPGNPQSLNLYSYVMNNPLIYIDPTGLDCISDTGATGGSPDTSAPPDCADDGSEVDTTTIHANGTVSETDSANVNAYSSSDLALLQPGTGTDNSQPTVPTASNNTRPGIQISSACQAKLLGMLNAEHGTNLTDANVTKTYNNGTAANIIVDASGLSAAQFNSFQPGRYSSYGGQFLLGFGMAGHIANEPGANAGAVFSNSNVGGNLSVHFAFHDDHGYANNPLGALLHLFTDVFGHNSRKPC